MIVNGSSNRCVWWWTQHLQSEENDKVRIVKSYGLRSDTIEDMLEEMMDTRDITAEVTELLQQSQNGPEFKAALESHGYPLVTGNRGLLILDSAANEHSLARRCGITMKEINAFMRDVDREALPTVEQGKAQFQERRIAGLEADRATVRDEIEWEERLAKAAIAKEEKEQRFVAPEDREKETRAGGNQPDTPTVEKLDQVIYAALLDHAIRDPQLMDQLQVLAWKMPTEFAVAFGESLATAREIQARKLELPDIDRLITERQIHIYKCEMAATDRLILDGKKAPALAYVRVAQEQREHESEAARLEEIIYPALLQQAIRNPYLTDQVQILAWKMPAEFAIEFSETLAIAREVQARKLELPDIHRLITERQTLAYKSECAEIDELIAQAAEREYVQRDPVREDMAWHDAVAQAAIEKEKAERQFAEPKPARETRAGGKEKEAQQQERRPTPAPELGKTQGEIRLARSLSHGPQGFANALEDRGFILARVTADDINREMEQLIKEWEERRRNPQTWMEHEGGFTVLTPELQASARRSFDEWEKQRDKNNDKDKGKEQAKKYTVEDYVDYVQKKWLEGPKSQLERATGGLAVITPFGSIYTLTPRNTGLDRDELPEYLKGIDRAPLLTVTDAQAVLQDLQEHRREEWFQNRREEWLARQPLGRIAGEIRLAYSLTQTGQEFASAIEDRGSILACMTGTDAERLNRWERQRLKEEWKAPAPENQLTQHNTGHDIDARAERLKDIDFAELLSVTAAQGVMKEFQQHRQEERQQVWERKREADAQEKHWPINPPQPERKSPGLFGKAATEATRDDRTENLTGPAAQVWAAWRQTGSDKAIAAALDENGIAFARATKEEADRSHKQGELARAAGNYSPRFKEGEIVIVTEARPERNSEPRRRVYKLDQSLAEKFVKHLDNRDKLQGIDATMKASDQRAQQRAADWQAIRLERATNIWRGGRTRAGNIKDNLVKAPAAILKPVTMGLNVIGKPLELLGNVFEGLFAPKLTPEQKRDGEIAARERQADVSDQLDHSNAIAQRAQERQQEEQREAARQRERERDGGGRER